MAQENAGEIRELAAKMTLRMFKDGRFTIEGPIDDKILCYGMLGMARDIIHRREPKQSNLLVAETIIDPNKLRGN